MNQSGKDTVYIDVEDEITSIIDKVASSKQKIVALVLPKRAPVLQSIVNMRLLKRSAENSQKNIVLITSEQTLLPLAGVAGLHVARNLQTKPLVPPAPRMPSDKVSTVQEGAEDIEETVDQDSTLPGDEEDETIELDNDIAAAPAIAAAAAKVKKAKKDSKLKVPNFDRFRLLVALGIVAVIALIIFGILATTVLPKAKIAIATDTVPVQASVSAIISTKADKLDEATKVVPVSTKTYKQTDTQKIDATGRKDLGEKASGSITISLKDCSQDTVSIPAGSTVSTNGLSFSTQADVTLESVQIGNQCKNSSYPTFSTDTVKVIAQSPGSNYNLAPSSFVVNGFSVVNASSGEAFSGGTTNVVKVIAQADVDSATQKINSKNTATADTFYKQLEDSGLFILRETGSATEPKVTTQPNVGDQADAVNVTQDVTYTVQTVQKADLTKLLTNAFYQKIDKTKQQLSAGNLLSGASIRLGAKKNASETNLSIEKSTTAIPIINNDEIKQLAAGKKSGELKNQLTSRPGIKDVDVKLSPFWVSSVPKKATKITVTVNKTANK